MRQVIVLMRVSSLWTTLSLLSGLPAPALAAPPVDLLSHRAAYRLELLEADRQSGILAVQGGLVVEWRAGCDGWISNQRLGFVAATDEGPGFSYDVRFSSWESRSNTELRFTMRSYDDGELAEEYLGQAALTAPGAPGHVRFSTPADQNIALPPGTIFPTDHVQKLIEAARAGRHFIVHDVFDGAGLDGLNKVTAVIGEPRTQSDGERRWPVHLAYYGLESEETLPDFELAVTLGETGVLRDVVLNYGDFTLKGRLEKLETLPAASCN